MAKLTEPPTYPNEEAMEQFKTNLVDDLGTPEALATVWMVVDADMSEPEKLATLFTMDSVLGFDLRDKWVEYQNVPETVKVRVSEREQLRSDKKYEQADAIRDELGEQGYTIEDSPAGPVVVKMSG